jgi:hypothetical protein
MPSQTPVEALARISFGHLRLERIHLFLDGNGRSGLRAAVHAVNEDYTSPGGHVFLANSYAQLNELTANNLRYETAPVNEYLLATLLSPVGVGALSQAVSQ